MKHTTLILGSVLVIAVAIMLIFTLMAGTAPGLASVGWHDLCSVGWHDMAISVGWVG